MTNDVVNERAEGYGTVSYGPYVFKELAIRQLLEREQDVIELRSGLRTGDTMTLKEVGQLLGVTRERVRQIEAKAIRKLQSPHMEERLRELEKEQEA